TNQMKEHAREQGERAKGEFQRLLQDNPLAIGAMTLAIGTAIGLSLPRSEKEDQWLGETRDRLFEEAKETVQGIIPKAKEFAGEFQQAAGDSLREKAGMR
ncbi:MAG: hypothetical protein KC592_03315, partial [Nitrospira sp.]|nr:hypothetical protein [Nitrospira sp.]